MVEPDRPKRKPCIHAGNYSRQTLHRNLNQLLPLRLPLEDLPLPPASDEEPLTPESTLEDVAAGVDDPDGELDDGLEDDGLSFLADDEDDDDLSLLALLRYESLR